MDRGDAIDTVVFDFGGVLVDWDPRYLYHKMFSTSAEMEGFLDSVCTLDWNLQMDAGRPFAEAITELSEVHPEYAAQIAAFHDRWSEMLGDTIPGMFDIVASLRARGFRTFGLTNWSAETFPIALERYPELTTSFDGVVVSGHEGVAKPDPALFRILIDRYDVVPERSLYIDDNAANVVTADELRFHPHVFTGIDRLRAALAPLTEPAPR
jgi:2-haloacid dehalogenase